MTRSVGGGSRWMCQGSCPCAATGEGATQAAWGGREAPEVTASLTAVRVCGSVKTSAGAAVFEQLAPSMWQPVPEDPVAGRLLCGQQQQALSFFACRTDEATRPARDFFPLQQQVPA